MAIQAGETLARRLFGGSTEAVDYDNVSTTVFTPMEYGCIGLSEEEAIARLGEANVEVFHTNYTPLEWELVLMKEYGSTRREKNSCYAKLVCNKLDNNTVVGFHVLGKNAGEITQGFGVAMKKGMTYDDIVGTVGIHPTDAEKFTTLKITKASGEATDADNC